MYLKSVDLKNIKGMRRIRMHFKAGEEAGWHVVLGDNGSGKSTLIRALALAFVGPDEAAALREDWSRWVTWGKKRGYTALRIRFPEGRDGWDRKTNKGPYPDNEEQYVRVNINVLSEDGVPSAPPKGTWGARRFEMDAPDRTTLRSYLWGNGYGWFSASFGPYRRFGSGTGDYTRIFYANPLVARHLSMFSHEVALGEGPRWLQTRQRDEADGTVSTRLIPKIKSLLNDTDLLPYNVTLEQVTPHALLFTDGNGVEVELNALSDGYTSILSLTLELLRQMAVTYGEAKLFGGDGEDLHVQPPGVVMIDEVDAHLHPTWQERIGHWFVKRFPNVQFIVATHSPLVCRAIGETGKVFRLEIRGESGDERNVLEEITGVERDKLHLGSIHRALESEGFDLRLSRSKEGLKQLNRLSQLNREARDRDLTKTEENERERLRQIFADHPAAY